VGGASTAVYTRASRTQARCHRVLSVASPGFLVADIKSDVGSTAKPRTTHTLSVMTVSPGMP